MATKKRRWVLAGRVSLLALFAAAFPFASARAQAADETVSSEEIIVTARKRSESVQDAPLSIQAFGEAQLEQLNVNSFEDYVRFTPSVSFVSEGPGQTKIVIRGVAESTGAADGGGRSSAALYLDEQPITVDAQSPDPRLVDIERVEVLSGPQGTLYGASSQSGTIRIITNKPDTSGFGGYVEAGLRFMDEGESSYDLNGALNIPIVQDRLALRITGFDAEEGGFIDNVLGETPGGTTDNADVVGDDINASHAAGGRVAARWEINPNWSATAAYVFQDVDVDGRSDYDPSLGDLQAVRFFNETYNDEWDQTALTIEGDLGFADLVVTGAYFSRRTSYVNDNTAYNQYLTTTAAYFPLYDFGPDPTGFNSGRGTDERTSIEARLSSADTGSRWSWIVGTFYQDAENGFELNSHVTDYESSPGFATAVAYDPLLQPTDVYFYQVGRYEQQQFALFGELSYDITDQLTATIGGRWFTVDGDGRLQTQLPFGALSTIVDGSGRPITTVEDSVLPFDEEGFTPKLNLTYTASENLLFYATYSQGFRLGGANRQRLGLAVPVQYDADLLTNYEFGWKSQWDEGRVTFNGAAFYMTWDDFISDIRNPNPATFFFVTANAGQAEIVGVEMEALWRPLDNLEIGGSATMLNAELSEPSDVLAGGVPEGARLPISPEFKAAVFAEYRFGAQLLGAEPYVRGDISYTGDSVNSIDPSAASTQDAYTLANLQAGLDGESWSVNLFINNVTDERAQLFINPNFFDTRVTPSRPREIGITLRRSF
ncbi:MAG: TonB-dependent receptor [Hyphomonadaceae bacterium]|nr:TonB-dependent receptor [Hyphomonadaceae bacterium]